jgi:arsenate reductase
MSSIKMYGIKNCQTMKKAMTWLESHKIDFAFHDYKKLGIDEVTLTEWLSQKPWDEVINKRGTTWRKLSDEDKTDIDPAKAIQLMLANTSLIKRPALNVAGKLYLGFDEALYQSIF